MRGHEQPLSALADVLAHLTTSVGGWDAAAVVLAVPGPSSDGQVWRLPTLLGPDFRDSVDFRAMARNVWPKTLVAVCNDLTAAGYRLVGEGLRDFLVVTIGSGIGSKLFLGGRPLLGPKGFGGEIGHWRVPGAIPLQCECGQTGHLGALASGRGCLQLAIRMAVEEPAAFEASALGTFCGGDRLALTTEMLVRGLHVGDPWAVDLLSVAAEALGAALALCHLATGTERIVVMGGFALACGEPLRRLIRTAAANAAWPTGLDWDDAIRLADFGDEPGLAGGYVYGRLMLAGELPCD